MTIPIIELCADVRVMGQHLGKRGRRQASARQSSWTPSVSQVAISAPKHYRDGA
jgi:hypothetical protein